MVGVVPSNHPTKGFQHGLEPERSVEDREDTLPEGVVEAANALAAADLGRTDQHHGRGGVHPAEELEDLMPGGAAVTGRLHGHLEIDQRDVDLLLLDDSSRLPPAPGLEASDPERV